MLNRQNRIGNHNVIEKLFARGRLHKDRLLIFKYEEVTGCPSQFAVIVSKKIHKKAVKRNRLRRQIYEAIHINLPSLQKNVRAVIIARPSSADNKIAFQNLIQSINTFFNAVQSHAE